MDVLMAVTSKRPFWGASRPLPQEAVHMLRRAMAAHQSCDFREATNFIDALLDIDPIQFAVLLMLGVLHAQHGSYLEAERLLRNALKINPNDDSAQFNDGTGLLGLQRLGRRLRRFWQGLGVEPGPGCGTS